MTKLLKPLPKLVVGLSRLFYRLGIILYKPRKELGTIDFFGKHFISDIYEIASGDEFPLPLIYSLGVRRANGHMRLALGMGERRSLLHLINRDARERFFDQVLGALREHRDCRIDVCEG